jgi:tetratricopeptide (TPR) repeat protein
LVLQDLGKWDPAETEYRKSIDLQQQLAAAFPAVPEYRHSLAGSHTNLANLLQVRGKLTQADTEYRAAIDLHQKLVAQFPADPDPRFHLGLSRNGRGALLRALAKPAQAESEVRAAIDLHRQLATDFPAVPKYRYELAASHNHLGILLRELGKPEQAETAYRQAVDLHKQLASDFPATAAYAIECAGTVCNLGGLVRDTDRPREALALFDQAITTLTPFVEKELKVVSTRQYLRNSYRGRAEALDLLRRHDDAVKDWERALSLSPEAHKTSYQQHLMVSRARAEQWPAALKDAEQLAKTSFAGVLYDCACVYALAHAKTKDDKQAGRAVELLRLAVAKGYRNVTHLKKDADLDSLRNRDDFRQFMAELGKEK